MHPRNTYREQPDFKVLAQSYPPLRKHLIGRSIDFEDDAAQRTTRCLTRALLHRDFNITIDLPPDRLCPPVPNRLNYVLWVQDIVDWTKHAVLATLGAKAEETETVIRGVDIGTGASAIYPLLACRLEPTWKFVATELDPKSYSCAQRNVATNGFGDRIRLVLVQPQGRTVDDHETQDSATRFGFSQLLEDERNAAGVSPGSGATTSRTLQRHTIHMQFTMCNPPFYGSAQEVARSEDGKETSPFGACTGAPVEMITPGGEVKFVMDMVRESLELSAIGEHDMDRPLKRRRIDASNCSSESDVPPPAATATGLSLDVSSDLDVRVRWYTSMLGKLSSVGEIVDCLKRFKVENYAITEFVQGQTRRWAIAWSLHGYRLPDDVGRLKHPNATLQRLLPPRNTMHYPMSTNINHRGNLARGSQVPSSSSLCEDDPISQAVLEALHTIDGVVLGQNIAKAPDERHPGVTGAGAVHDVVALLGRDTWSRKARRMKKQKDASSGLPSTRLALVCSLGYRRTTDSLEFQWVFGSDRALFESFVSHVGRKVVDLVHERA